jgi:hypothetical protein
MNNKNCYTITGIKKGGAIKYLNDLKNNYPNTNFIIINSLEILKTNNFKDNEIIFVQHLFFTNIDIADIIYLCRNNKLKLIISIHDWYWINEKVLYEFDKKMEWEKNYNKTNIVINPKIVELFNLADDIICPSYYVYNIYTEIFKNINFKMIYHNDYDIDINSHYIPIIKNNTINIGNLNTISQTKGSDVVNFLSENIKSYHDYNINYLIIGKNLKKYEESEYYDIVMNNNIHCLTFLNNHPETYCYSLTKALNIGSVIIYNNIGSFIERIPYKEHYFKINTKTNNKNYYEDLQKEFYKMLDYIILNNGKYLQYNNTNNIIKNNIFYDNLFL